MKYNKIQENSNLFTLLTSFPGIIMHRYVDENGRWSNNKILWSLHIENTGWLWKIYYKPDNFSINGTLPQTTNDDLSCGIEDESLENALKRMESWLKSEYLM